jgi:hypothetical protein
VKKTGTVSALKLKRSFRGSKLRPGGSKWSSGGSIAQWSQIHIALMRSRIRIQIGNPDPIWGSVYKWGTRIKIGNPELHPVAIKLEK